MDDLRGIDINLVVVLDAVLTERSLTRAGEAIGLTQPAVSGAVAKLRKVIGDPLLIRSGRTFELTDRARALQPIVREAVVQVDRTFTLRPAFDPATSDRRFRISASDYALSVMTAPLLEVLADEAPGTSVEFDALYQVDPVDLLRKDVIVATSDRSLPGKHQSLFSDRFVCLVRRDHPRLQDGALSMEDLKTLPYVDVTFADGVPMVANNALMSAGVTPVVAMRVSDFLPVPFMIQGTDGYGFVPERVADLYGDQLGLMVARTPVPVPMLVEVVYWHPSKKDDPALRWLVGILRKTAERVEFGSDLPLRPSTRTGAQKLR
ncbi:LysR family transcriptional regulator [Tersicoccus solisilvae]|uniref:LysR family transcriptional regulator n=1 Tax=Tersicoccus solisilvae TaxID=1882339 RepID=A0ABQ1NWW0_9MICC|nr:LysR family transcriptional regulator [Tersicoccus solisilvae]GGC84576.1 LysR family transcriptional regulator [Tersicoccus solisilvae]